VAVTVTLWPFSVAGGSEISGRRNARQTRRGKHGSSLGGYQTRLVQHPAYGGAHRATGDAVTAGYRSAAMAALRKSGGGNMFAASARQASGESWWREISISRPSARDGAAHRALNDAW